MYIYKLKIIRPILHVGVGLVLIINVLYLSQYNYNQYLAPNSQIQLASRQAKFDHVIGLFDPLKRELLQGNAPDAAVLKERILELANLKANNLEEFRRGRKLLSWWLFYGKNQYPSTFYLGVLEKGLSLFEQNFFSTLPKELLNFKPQNLPEWSEEMWNNLYLQSDFRKLYQNPEQKGQIDQWLMTEGVLIKSLYLIFGVSLQELNKAIQTPEGFQVKLYPKGGIGGWKYVFQVEVILNGKSYYMAFNGFRDIVKKEDDMEREINTLNMLYSKKVPVFGTASYKHNHRFWLEEYIHGDHLVEFVLHHASLKNEKGENAYTPDDILKIWRKIQVLAAKQFISIFLHEFSGTHLIKDPLLPNIKATWRFDQENQIQLEELKIYDVGAVTVSKPIETVVVDVGSIKTVSAAEAWDHFDVIYTNYFVNAEGEVRKQLPATLETSDELNFSNVPTLIQFLEILLEDKDLSAQEKFVLVSLLLRGLNAKRSELEFYNIDEEIINGREDMKFLNQIENYLLNEAKHLILSFVDLSEEPDPARIEQTREEWQYLLQVSSAQNSKRLFKDINGILEILMNEAKSVKIRQLAREIHNKRTNQNRPQIKIEALPPASLESAI